MIYFITNNQRLFEPNNFEIISEDQALTLLNSENFIEFQIDTETTGLCPHLNNVLCVQIGNGKDEFVFEYTSITNNFKSFLNNSEALFIAHNVKFDYKFLLSIGIKIKKVYCTQLVEQVIRNGLDFEFNLNSLTKKYLGIHLEKEVRNEILLNGLTERAIIYSANDVKYLQEIKKHQLLKIKKDFEEIGIDYYPTIELENEVVKVFSLMEYNGISLDKTKWKDIIKQVKESLLESEKVLDNCVINNSRLSKYVPKERQLNLFGFEERLLNINWKSSKQKLEILQKSGLNIKSTGADVLQKEKNNNLIAKNLLDYNKLSKLNSSFGENILNIINKQTNRIHPDFWQIVETGRISCKNPNLLNIPSKGDLGPIIRSAFVAEKGYKWVGGDYSGMELAIIADLSKDDVWVSALNNGEDLHSKLCSATFNIPIDKVKEPFPFNPSLTYRDVQKTVNFGIAYGISEFKLSDRLNISKKEALDIINNFKKNVPIVSNFLEKLARYGLKKGFIITPPPFNRIRYFSDYEYYILNPEDNNLKGSIERKSFNTPIQGMNADIIKAALINVQKEIEDNKWDVKILLSVYDEINTECIDSKAEEWKIKLEEIMVSTAKKYIKNVPIKADCYVNDYWKK
jgi:DNA polymerase-1